MSQLRQDSNAMKQREKVLVSTLKKSFFSASVCKGPYRFVQLVQRWFGSSNVRLVSKLAAESTERTGAIYRTRTSEKTFKAQPSKPAPPRTCPSY